MKNTIKESIEATDIQAQEIIQALYVELIEAQLKYKAKEISKAEWKAAKKEYKENIKKTPFITGKQLQTLSWVNFAYGAAAGIGIAALIAKLNSEKD